MARYRIAFIIEQALGHVTHASNLQKNVPQDPEVEPHWILPAWETSGFAAKVPLYNSNWTVRAGLRARQGLRKLQRQVIPDALFFHTQVTAVLASDWVARYPSVVSLDATPRQYDELGEFYAHDEGPAWLEGIKWRLNRRTFAAARQLVTWSQWTKDGLVADYDVPAVKITVIPPGVNSSEWARPTPRRRQEGEPVRVLFVGGDLERKGGRLLIEAFRRLRAKGLPLELHLATRTVVEEEPGLFVYNDLQPNSERLKQLYFDSDIFCLPTYGEGLPMVLSEAGAAGLPVISTNVAAIPELVRNGETGLIIEPGDLPALSAALRRLVTDPAARLEMGRQAAALVRAEYDAPRNAQRLLELLKEVADAASSPRPRATRSRPSRADVLLTVSGEIPMDIDAQIEAGKRPLTDYVAMAATFNADLLDYRLARQAAGPLGRLLARAGGSDLLLAWAAFQLRRRYRVLFTDGEQIGIPLAILLKYLNLSAQRPRHLMIAHILSVGKKELLFDRLALQSHIDVFFPYSRWQKQFIEQRWDVPSSRVVFTPFMVDSHFFSPEAIAGEERPESLQEVRQPLICAVGLEFRDYPTLIEAVRGLDVQVIIAAASPWSKRSDTTQDEEIPENVMVRRFSQAELRHLYDLSKFVVMPLFDVPFQAGVTAILEAMAMEKAIVCSRTSGQTDVIVDGVTGLYVPPEDPAALRQAIQQLLDRPEQAEQMGQAGRRVVEDEMSLVHYVERLNAYVQQPAPAGATRFSAI